MSTLKLDLNLSARFIQNCVPTSKSFASLLKDTKLPSLLHHI